MLIFRLLMKCSNTNRKHIIRLFDIENYAKKKVIIIIRVLVNVKADKTKRMLRGRKKAYLIIYELF